MRAKIFRVSFDVCAVSYDEQQLILQSECLEKPSPILGAISSGRKRHGVGMI